jgi:hypothetical protein
VSQSFARPGTSGESKVKATTRVSTALPLAVVLFAACGLQKTEQPLDEVTVQLKWTHQAQSAEFHAADQNGPVDMDRVYTVERLRSIHGGER